MMIRIRCADCKNTDCGNSGTGLTVAACSGFSNPKPTTNADHIRAMTDEELSKFTHSLKNKCGDCPVAKSNVFCSTFPTCKDAWLAWLKQEAEEGET